MENLYSQLASELEQNFPVQESRTMSRAARGIQTQSILQLNYIPLIIDLDYYRNPHSSENPTGDYKAAYRLYVLSDNASPITTYFENSHSISSVWDSIIHSATTTNTFVSHVIKQAQDNFLSAKMSGMGGIPENWFQVNATPANWYDLVQDPANLKRIEIEPQSETSPFFWNINSSTEISLDKNSSLDKVCMDVLKVDFARPWLQQELFDTNWKIEGVDRGYFSNGNAGYNDGILPLITQSMLVGTNLSIEGHFSEEEINLLSTRSIEELSIGPFAIKTCSTTSQVEQENATLKISSRTTQVLGYISKILPLCPRESC